VSSTPRHRPEEHVDDTYDEDAMRLTSLSFRPLRATGEPVSGVPWDHPPRFASWVSVLHSGRHDHSYEIKLNRAEKHLQDVRKVIADYVASEPYRVAKEEEPEALRGIWNITLTEPIPADVAPTVGDCIHNLRSVLDNWVHEFSAAEAGRDVRDTGFPILEDKANWDVGPCGGRKNSGAFRVRRLPEAVKTVIEACQPFENSLTMSAFQRTELRRLHLLDIGDKHQALNVVTASMDVIGWAVPEGTSGDTSHLVYREVLELNTPKPMLLIEFPTREEFDVSVYPSSDLRVVLMDEEAHWWPPTELTVVLGGFFNVVSFVIHLLNSAYETGESPFVPIEPSSE
jgi:hypothetical protein